MAFDFFKGYTSDQAPSIYDVARRQELAKQLLSNKLAPEQMGSPIGVIANALSGAGSAYENSQAASEQQQGLTNANSALAAALQGDPTQDPSSLIQAGGNPFLPDNESSLVGDLIKRKLGIGETFFGTPIITTDAEGKQHLYQPGSMGDTREMNFGGNTPAPQQQYLNTGTGFVAAPKYSGVTLPTSGTASGVVPINNAQSESDKSYGHDVGSLVASAPQQLQKAGQSLVLLNRQADTTASAIDQAIQQIQSNPAFMSGTLGSFLKAVPGVPAYDLAKTLTTINANQVIGTLDQMRANSPTGASGMGSVSNFEDELLGSINGSADQGQTGAQLVANLQKMKTTLNNLKSDRNQAFEGDKARLNNPPPAPPIIGGVPGPPVPLAPMPSAGKTFVYNPASGQLE